MYSSLPEFIISLVIELIKLIILMSGVLSFELNKNKKRHIGVLFAAAGIIAVLYKVNFMNAITLPVVSMIIACFMISGNRKFIYVFIAELSICCADEAITAIMCRLISFEYGDYYIISNSVSIILITFLSYMFQNRKKPGIYDAKSGFNLIYLIVLLLAQVVILFYTSSLHDKNKQSRIFMFAIIGMIIVVEITMVYSVNKKNYYYNISEINQKMLESQEKYYMKLLDHENEIRKFRHDMNNHIIGIEALLKEEKYSEAGEYLVRLKDSFINTNPEIKTGNTIVSAIASDCAARHPAAELEWNGLIPPKLNISNVDICTLFSNVLGNAFENAVLSESEKKVSVKIETVTNNMIVTVRNNIGVPVKIKDGVFETSKDDKINHGIGTQNIKNVVESNKGILEYNFDNQYFEIKIILPNVLKLF